MLVLSRRLNEKILIPGIQVTVQVVAIKSNTVRLGIEAPPEVAVLRAELPDRDREWGPAPPAAASAGDRPWQRLNQLVDQRLQIAGKGLSVLREQLHDQMSPDAAGTIDRIEEELQMLRCRLERETGTPPPLTPKPTQPKRRALLVEDNANERELLALFLRTSGLEVETAGDGHDALDYLHHHTRPDVVLLDMAMPRCDGPTVVREIRRDPAYAGIKLFAVTGHMQDEFDLASGPAGVDRWFQKPIDPGALVHEVFAALNFPIHRL